MTNRKIFAICFVLLTAQVIAAENSVEFIHCEGKDIEIFIKLDVNPKHRPNIFIIREGQIESELSKSISVRQGFPHTRTDGMTFYNTANTEEEDAISLSFLGNTGTGNLVRNGEQIQMECLGF